MPLIGEDKRKEFIRLLGDDFVKEIETKAETRAKELQAAGVDYKDFKMIDTEARAQLDALSKQMTELTAAVAEKAKPPVDEDDEDAKKKKDDADSAFKKEVSEAIVTLAKSQTQMAQNLKNYIDLTPNNSRRASKSSETLVPDDDPALKELAQGATGEKSNEDKIFNAAFGFMKTGGA